MPHKVLFNGDETYSRPRYPKDVWLRSQVVLTRDTAGNLVLRVQIVGKTLVERKKVGRVAESHCVLQFEGLSPTEVRQWLLIQKSHLPTLLNAMPVSIHIGNYLNSMAGAVTDLQKKLERWRHRLEEVGTVRISPTYDEATQEFIFPECG